MGLSRLDNFLKSARGTILYVDPNSLDATDSIENQGNSLTRPFKTIQRALIEASRFSHQKGLDNDRFEKTSIVLYPGDHIVDNRPGLIPDGENNYKLRSGSTTNNFPPLDLSSIFDLTNSNNILYKLNSVYGGVIVPRGTSIIGMDLRKTRIRPLYVPDPENDNIERSAVFRITGGCYFWQFTILDSDPNGVCYKDYTLSKFVPNFSHHKLTAFEYVDGVNKVSISDTFQTDSWDQTDLEMYYAKVGLAYGQASGREIFPDYPTNALDINPKIDEYRIVGSRGAEVGITSIKSGDGTVGTTKITVTLDSALAGLDVDTPIQISGVDAFGYDGQYVVSEVVNSTQIIYNVQNVPTNLAPTVTGATLNINVDTVTSASPYIFNISLRSVYGMCGLHADGDKVDGFKSMVVAQFTGIGLQKDKKAFVKYNNISGVYDDYTASGNENINTDSLARFKPTYENYHIKCSNDAYLQLVSVFAIGYATHFLADSGGDQSINNSNSNFGAKALFAQGFRRKAFPKDDIGYITHIIPPKELETSETTVEYFSVDVAKTVSVGNSSRLYLYNQTNQSTPPEGIIEGYRIGAKRDETLNVLITQSGNTQEYSAKIVMPGTTDTSEKIYHVGRSAVGVNSISNDTITLIENHKLQNGEIVRIISNTGQLPDGIDNNQLYYTITSGITTNQIKLAQTFNDTISSPAIPITINNRGGSLSIVSRVSDKKSGEVGHPVQYDTSNSQWYVNVSSASSENNLYSTITTLGTSGIGAATPRTYLRRKPDTRSLVDAVYRLRYVIPSDSPLNARPPLDGFVLQESNTSIGSTDSEVAYQFNPSTVNLSNSTELRNQKIITNAKWESGTKIASVVTELPHKLTVGSQVEILNIKTTTNTTGVANSAFNGTFTISGISSSRHFSFSLENDPGTFTSDIHTRTVSLPHFRKKKTNSTFTVYRSREVKKYIPGQQDGIYHLYVINASNSPSVTPFNNLKFSQPVQNLYPQTNRDNPTSDPNPTVSFALPSPIGQVVVNEPQNSITRETVEKKLVDFGIGIGITEIVSSSAGTAHTIYTEIDHNLNRIVNLSIVNGGSSYVPGNYYGVSLVGAAITNGKHANARVTVGGAGTVTAIEVMYGGGGYEVGATLSLVGVGTLGSGASVQVSGIYDNVGDCIRVFGINDTTYNGYNSLYRITKVNDDKSLNVISSSAVASASTTGLGSTITSNANLILTGQTLQVSSLTYDQTIGIATVVTTQNHGLFVDNKIILGGADSSVFNSSFVVKKINTQTSFSINVGIRTDSPSTSGTIYVYRDGFGSNGGNILDDIENIGGRQNTEYNNITATLSAGITTSQTNLSVLNIGNYDFKLGDFLLIDEEIMRIKTSPVSNPVQVFRGLLGTRKTSHETNSVIRRINPLPVELRRNSLIRASSHTFEYLGFGPGNYSSAFPERQNRTITPAEELLAQATKSEGGVVVYTGMNADGDFYVGNKKVSSTTGQEEVFDAPVPTVTGEDPGVGSINIGFDVLTPLEVSISRSIRVEGGSDANLISEFDGPVIFNNKITSTSDKGIEANSIFLQGDASVSRKYTVGISTPSLSGNPGDVVYLDNPEKGGHLGWVYTVNNEWHRFGNVSLSKNLNIPVFDQVGIGTTNVSNNLLTVGVSSAIFNIDNKGVGIGTTSSNYKLNVSGATNIVGNLSVDGIISGTFALDSLWINDGVGVSTTRNVGIGTTLAKANTALYVNGKTVIDGTLNVFEVIEKATITSTVLSGTINIDLASNNVYYFTSNSAANWTFNFRGDSSTTLNNFLEIGDSITVAILTTQGTTPYYNNAITIDGTSITPKSYGGYQIVSGNANSIDSYTYVIIKTAANTYTVLYSQSQYA